RRGGVFERAAEVFRGGSESFAIAGASEGVLRFSCALAPRLASARVRVRAVPRTASFLQSAEEPLAVLGRDLPFGHHLENFESSAAHGASLATWKWCPSFVTSAPGQTLILTGSFQFVKAFFPNWKFWGLGTFVQESRARVR